MSRNLIIILMVSLCTFIEAEDLKPCIKVVDGGMMSLDTLNVCEAPLTEWVLEDQGIIGILCHRNFAIRKQILDALPEDCPEYPISDLVNDIKGISKITNQTANLIEFLFLPDPSQIYSTIIQNIVSGVYDENGLISFVVCSLTNTEKADLGKAFPTASTVLTDYGNKYGDEYKGALLEICWAQRKDEADPAVTDQVVDDEVKCLKEKNGPDFIKVVKEMFRKYSNPDLQKILKKYNSVNGCDLGDKIWEIFPEREKEVYVTLARAIDNLQMFYAKLLYHFIKGESINGEFHAINYIITIRTECDLGNIYKEYKKLYNSDLLKDLKERFYEDTVYYESLKMLFGDCTC